MPITCATGVRFCGAGRAEFGGELGMKQNFYDAMKVRGLVASVSHEAELIEVLATIQDEEKAFGQPLSIYAGFDPTAKSLHVGHLVPLFGLRRAQDAGLRPIVLFGGATGLVGDPTGRTEMRQMHSQTDIEGFIAHYRKLTERYFDLSGPCAPLFLNNHDWLGCMTWIQFARDVGVHFTIARLLAADVNRTRFEAGGLTFLELGYQLLQAYDFQYLNHNHNCVLQLGGNDQWSNILAGADLIRRTSSKKAFALTFPLLTASDGQKIGKTAGNAVWLDPDMYSPYDFFQYFRNIKDEDLEMFARTFTFLHADAIAELCNPKVTAINAAKERLATEVTTLVHGAEEARKALGAARALFSGEGAPADAPSFTLSAADIEIGVGILDVLVNGGLCKSKSEARKIIEGNGLLLNGTKVTDVHLKIVAAHFESKDGEALIRKGKKDFLVLRRS